MHGLQRVLPYKTQAKRQKAMDLYPVYEFFEISQHKKAVYNFSPRADPHNDDGGHVRFFIVRLEAHSGNAVRDE